MWPVLLAALLEIQPSRTQGQSAPPSQGTISAEADVKECKEQLNRILEALRHYQAQYHRLPNWFYNLTPEFIADPKTFVCPVVRRLEDLRSWRAGVRGEVFDDPILPTSYSYEFSAKEHPLASGVKPTYVEYKTRQMALVGDAVPVVRCFAHGPDQILNLSIGGRIYPSGLYWENGFPNLASHEKLADYSVFRDELTAFLTNSRSYPPRSTAASPQLLDLTGSYNFGLNETVRFGSTGGEDFPNLSRGAVKLDRVNLWFDVRGRIQVKGKRMRLPFPARVDGIKVDQQCRRVHFLCGTVYGSSTGNEIGRFEVHYADGQSSQIRIIYGQDVQDWSSEPQKPQTGSARLAWEGASQAGQSSQAQGRLVRLYHLKWENPLPEARIASLDFVSALADTAPFLIAITLE